MEGDDFDLASLDLDAAQALTEQLQRLGRNGGSPEEVAGRTARYLHDHLITPETGRRSCALVRFFTTALHAGLSPALQRRAQEGGGVPLGPATVCLVLLGTAGERPEWCSPASSLHHQAIPLISAELPRRFPMVARLVHDLGMPVAEVGRRSPELVSREENACSVFFVPRARGNALVPAQDDFVIPAGIESVLGFGGWLPTGDLFATVLFSRVTIPPATAELFRRVAVGVREAVVPWLDLAWR